MRILFLNPVGILGGAEHVLLDVMASLRPVLPAGSSMKLICLGDGPLLEEARKLGVETQVVPFPPAMATLGESGLSGGGKLGKAANLGGKMLLASPAAIGYIRRLRAAVLASNADVIHSNGLKTHLLSRMLPRRAGKVVLHVHDLLGNRALMAGGLKHIAGHAVSAIAISQAVATDLATVLPNVPVTTVLNGIDTDRFTPGPVDGERLDALAHLPSAARSVVRVGLIATYARWKGHDVFIEAAGRLEASQPARFYIIGGSIYQTAGSQYSRDELQKKVAAAGLSDRFGFVDFQRDPVDIYRSLDVVVHASTKPEPFGRTIVESMACARPTLVSNAGGAAELFMDGVDAIGVTPGDVEGLARAMQRLIDDSALRERLGAAARQTAVQRFDRRRIGPQMLAVYQRAVGTVAG